METPPVSYEIRPLDADDTAAFLRLKEIGLESDPASFIASPGEDAPDYPDRVRVRLARASLATGDVVIGAFAASLVGIIAITRDPHRKRRHKADLHGMYIMPGHRGRGLGRRLVNNALELARQIDGLEEIQLIVATHNHAAVRLYEQFGFVRAWTESRAMKVEDGYIDGHHMLLDLVSRPPGEAR